ncbi:hypothetical protein [Methylophaga sp.]|jgi:uncharacterized membrane protein|uniref:hypothetical protein n=1 Tax=Methylophaga sp. TaxID=2024840 RepID=UPI00271E2BB8|nr:hypothetical protein [Methylophaga sp.]MDO8825741.1 hypothetical protein [Methylophaga sp.]
MALIETGDDISSIKLIYIFNLVGSLIYPILIMGAVVAYEKKQQAPAWLQSHYLFQINGFFISLILLMISWGLLYVGNLYGLVVMAAWIVWNISRSVKGWKTLKAEKAITNPKSWLFG